MKGFDNMRKKTEDLEFTFKKGTTGNEILKILKDAGGSYMEEGIKSLLSDKQPDTVRKMIRRLERAGYVLRKKGNSGEIVVVLSTKGQEFLNVKMVIGNTPQKISRQGNMGAIYLMFNRSNPFDDQEDL